MAKVTKANLDEIHQDLVNLNKHAERGSALTRRSIEKFGARLAGILDNENRIVDGNDRQIAYGEVDLNEIEIIDADPNKPVYLRFNDLDLADPTNPARELQLALHRSAVESFTVDAENLLALMPEGLDTSDWLRQDELDALLAGLVEKEPIQDAGADISKADELQAKWQVKPGDMFALGRHRLVCGDCTDRATVERLMQGERAAITFTSPPYNAGVSAQLSGNTHIGDNLYRDEYDDDKTEEDYLNLLCGFTSNALDVSEYVFVNIQSLAGNKHAFVKYWYKFLDRYADVAIWDKTNAAPAAAQRVMDSRFEFVIIFSHGGTRAIGTRDFRGMVHNVYTGQPQRNNEYASSHAATFPIELPSHFVETFTNPNDIVLEPFCGTGTTLMSCEQLNRQCRAVEISEAYCAVILQRWLDSTGQMPILLADA